ncbi:AAA family ATPase [Ructibacterium gallinarum]|uniref:AAA family ATPase n=1 Tax=Ructibacterium gallinarum TaxID=2779355 RepID=A0A9D5RAW7_9FIRM|nr:AAA family ATPase [Ructibacterium gallinarum]MBE5039478.1 AAA family ATPase [Ructibacterium gallinarum]
MERIMIIGCPGSGKSTLAVKLAEKLKLPLIHLDKLYWKEGWVESSAQEFSEKLEKALEQTRWIIDGNYGATIRQRLEKADTVIFLDYSRYLCMERAIKRIIFGYGKTRSDMGDGCPERMDLDFLKYIWFFRKNNRPGLAEMIAKTPEKVIIIRNRKEYQCFFKKIF